MAVALVRTFHTLGMPVTPPVAPVAGNLLVLFAASRTTTQGPSNISGWTPAPEGVLTTTAHHPRDHMAFYRVAQTGDSSWGVGSTYVGTEFTYAEFSGAGIFQGSQGSVVGFSNSVVCGGAVTTSGATLIVGGCAADFTNDTDTMTTTPSAGVTELSDKNGAAFSPGYWTGYRIEAAGGTFTVGGTATMGGGGTTHGMAGHTLVFGGSAEPVADFTADTFSGVVPTTIIFEDLSTNTPTSWLWDFGDGSTSTSQNPSHVYAAAGSYTVSLTATNADGSDTETKTAYISIGIDVGYEAPGPGLALIEIYASEAGSARWDEATWDDDVWSTAAWQDVTPQSVQAVIRWGSDEAYMGILSKPSAGSWSIDLYDPNRILDPANPDSPYFGDLEPGLPIRITHRNIVIRQGIVEGLSHSFADDSGFIRVQDNIAPLANATVPDDVDLGDTLYARARAAIAAAGLAVTVLPDPPSGDPALVPWETGTSQSAWAWIRDAAEAVLHIPYIDRIGRLGFRPWASPLARARDLTATEMIDLQSVIEYRGQYSVVQALDDMDTLQERASTPPPRYGARTYTRDTPTPDAEGWADAVLADRVKSALRWVPGTIYPLTADSVEKYATIEAVEVISLSHLFTSPAVASDIIVVGGEIRITAKRDDAALWWFRYEAAETPVVPLITEDASGFVLDEGGTLFLYPE